MVEQATHNRQVTGSNPVGASIKMDVSPVSKFNCRHRLGRRLFILGAAAVVQLLYLMVATPACQAQELRPPQPTGGTPAVLTPPADPNVRRNVVPLELDEFRYPDKVENGRPSIQILSISSELYPGKKCEGCIAVRVRLRNDSAVPVIMDGDATKASFGGDSRTAMSEADLLRLTGGQFTKNQIGKLAAVTAVSIGLAEPIVQDMMTTSRSDFTKSYGVDEIRRKAELARFGKRILLPDEELEAAVYFKSTAVGPDNVSVPILTYPDGQPSTCLTVKAPTNLPRPVATPPAQPRRTKE